MTTTDDSMFELLLGSWDRNNTILVNLLRAVPEGGLEARAMEGGPNVAQLFSHMHSVRLFFISENSPDFPVELPEEEWADERDPDRMAQLLNDSARAVRDVIERHVKSGEAMKRHFDHPMLFLQMMIWHEGYHHGQIKLALKISGRAIPDEEAGRGTWGVWMRKT